MTNKSTTHGLGASFNAGREVPQEPKPAPPEQPAAPSTPSYAGHAKTNDHLRQSGVGDRLLPAFKQFSTGLDDAMRRQRLEDAVLAGELTPAEAEQIERAVRGNQ